MSESSRLDTISAIWRVLWEIGAHELAADLMNLERAEGRMSVNDFRQILGLPEIPELNGDATDSIMVW